MQELESLIQEFEVVPFPQEPGLEALLIDHLEPVVREKWGIAPQSTIDRINAYDATKHFTYDMPKGVTRNTLKAINDFLREDDLHTHFLIRIPSERPLSEFFGSEITEPYPVAKTGYMAITLSRRDVIFSSEAHGTNAVRAMLAEPEYRQLFLDEFRFVRDQFHEDVSLLQTHEALIQKGKEWIVGLVPEMEGTNIHATPYRAKYARTIEQGFEYFFDRPDGLLHQPLGLRIDMDGHLRGAVGDGWASYEVTANDGITRRYMEDPAVIAGVQQRFMRLAGIESV